MEEVKKLEGSKIVEHEELIKIAKLYGMTYEKILEAIWEGVTK